MKYCMRFLVVLLLTSTLTFFACSSGSSGSGGSSGGGSGGNDTTVAIAVIQDVVVPVMGEAPTTTAIDSDEFTGTITWTPDHDTFAAATTYTANIVLTPKTGFTLTGVIENFFTVPGADTVSNAVNSGNVTAVFPQTGTASDIDVTFASATQTGGTSGQVDSTALTLAFSADPATLAASNIFITGATKGALSGTGTTRTIAISNISVVNGETVSVTITSPSGYSIAGSPKTAVVYRDSFAAATTPGQQVTLTAGGESFTMIYANNQTSITFPFSPVILWPEDDETATLTRKFFMSETLATNALVAEVMQWAYDNGKFSATVGDPNGLDDGTAKYGDQELLDLNDSDIRINYSGGSFTVDSGYEDHPVVCVTWYGAIMFCNWLTEMRDGNTDNVVYGNIDTTWDDEETTQNADKSGYRLASSEEWEYAARYIGTTAPTIEPLASDYVARNVNDGAADLTAGYYWTPADYASGATDDYLDSTETRAVAWYVGDPDMGISKLMPVGQKVANQLGLDDMSGNVREWCFTANGIYRVRRNGDWLDGASIMRVGYWSQSSPQVDYSYQGFRFARTQ